MCVEGALHDGATKGVAGRLALRLGHDITSKWVAWGLSLRLGHDGAAEGVARALGRGVLGVGLGRHFESWGGKTVKSR